MELSRSTTLNQTSGKNLHMKELIEAINEYLHIRSENTAFVIKKFLQAYSVTIDSSVFDPESTLGAQFFVSLYELFNKLDPDSQMAWDCVDVLSNACKNFSARQALIKTYQFLPPLARLLSDHLSSSKKKKLLTLMQDVSSGITLSWQVPHLGQLLKMLTKWVEVKDDEIVCLSLGVLVNVCYKNLPAIYTLSRIVDIKKFLRFCLPLRGPLMEVHVCKLMIIIDHSYDDIPKKTLQTLIEPTFSSIMESLTKNDPVMLRLVVDFFVDLATLENAAVLKEYQHYNEKLSILLKLIESRTTLTAPKDTSHYEPECVTLILKLILTLETNRIGNLSSLYPKIIDLALNWLHCQQVSQQSLMLLTVIIQSAIQIDDGGSDREVLSLLTAKMPAFIATLDSDAAPTSMEGCRRLGALLQLLRTMLKSSISKEVINAMNESMLHKIFSSVLADNLDLSDLPKIKFDDGSTSSTDVIETYVYAIGLVNDLSQHDAGWLELLSLLMENRSIHSILAQALYGSKPSVKQMVLEISKYPRFPMQKVAEAMGSVQNMFATTRTPARTSTLTDEINFPILSVPQMEMLDETLIQLKKVVDTQKSEDIPVRQVMELYEYKLASMSHSERIALTSIEASSERCVQLQHRLAQMTTELNKMRQNIYLTENRLEKTNKANEEIRKLYLDVQKQGDVEIAKYEKLLEENETRLKETRLKLTEMTELKNNRDEQIEKFTNLISKLEDNGNKLEKQLQKREEQLKNGNSHIDKLNAQIQDLQKLLSQKETKLAELTKQYLATKEIISTITRVANSQYP